MQLFVKPLIIFLKIFRRFHLLSEFDNGKRSCRKRLADHNRRRRKTQQPGQEIPKSQLDIAQNSSPGNLTSKRYYFYEYDNYTCILYCKEGRNVIWVRAHYFVYNFSKDLQKAPIINRNTFLLWLLFFITINLYTN